MRTWRQLRLWSIFFIFIVTVAAWADAPPYGYYRYPTAYGDQVVFNAEGDLWTAPLAGGVARRLTIVSGSEVFPLFSPDGKWIAFSGNYDGNMDVYVIPASGGEPRRLTFRPGGDYVTTWTKDGKIVFRSNSSTGQGTWLAYTISPEGGYPEALPVDEAAMLTFEPNGDRIAYNRSTHNYNGYGWWKRYRGGMAEPIWVGSLKTHDYKVVTNWDGNNMSPMWYKDRIYYMRDDGVRMNVFSMKPDGSDIKQHTKHHDWDARWPSLSQGKIAYSLGADIRVYDIDKDADQKIDILLPSDRVQSRDKFVSPDDYTGDFALSPDGKRLLVGARGELFTAPTERRGVIRQITRSPNAREKSAAFTPKGDQILTWSDLTGEEALYLYSAKGNGEPKKLADGKGGWNFAPEISPDGKYAVYGDNNRKLQLLNMETGGATEIDTSGWEITQYSWSPDSRYIAYTIVNENEYGGVHVYDVAEKKVHNVTDPMFSSHSATWDPKGKWLYFISGRFMNPHGSVIDWSFVVEDIERIYALALDTATTSPYQYTEDSADSTKDGDKDKDKDGEKSDKKDDKDKKDKDKDKEEKVTVKIVWGGLADRIVEIPVDPGNFSGLSAIEGKLYYLAYPSEGWRGGEAHDGDGPRSALHMFDIKKKKDYTVVKGASSYTLSADLKKIAVRKKSDFVIMDAGDKKEPEADEDDKDAGLHLEDWIYDVDPRLEWQQIFNEAWRLQRDFFYDPNMHGINWKEQKEHYGSLLDRISSRDELNDLLGQLIGELSAGHTYVAGGDVQSSKSVGVGMLGIDATRTSDGFYRIEKIYKGDAWDAKNTSPLGAVGLNVKQGDYLVAIDGRPVTSVQNYEQLLVNRAGKLTPVSVNGKPSLDGEREIIVKPLGSEYDLRYWDWVNGRIAYVKEKAGDKIAYVHLSDMGVDGLVQWMREYYPQERKKAIILDVRYNGGGNIAEWILSQLEHTTWSWGTARNGQRYKRPGNAFYGYKIALCNGHTGSDGETFSEGFKRLELGPLVGKRTWGGWVGIRSDKPFVDKGYNSQPEFTGWGVDGKDTRWLVEGPGVSPDVDVENHPKPMMEGKDEQLDYAIDYLLGKLKADPKDWPKMPPFPIKRPQAVSEIK